MNGKEYGVTSHNARQNFLHVSTNVQSMRSAHVARKTQNRTDTTHVHQKTVSFYSAHQNKCTKLMSTNSEFQTPPLNWNEKFNAQHVSYARIFGLSVDECKLWHFAKCIEPLRFVEYCIISGILPLHEASSRLSDHSIDE